MSIIGSNILAGASGSGVSAYEIEQSLRFNSDDNAYLSRTFGTGGSSVNFTISLWAKKASNDDSGFMLLSTSGTAGSGRDQFYINSAEKFQFYGSSQNNEDSNNVLLRDPSAWYHIVVACDMDNGTATDRIKVFYNGQRQASVSTSITSFSFFGGNRVHYIGTENDGVYNNGYIAEYHYVDGTTKDETDFGEYDDNGVWRPIKYTGSYGTEGFYLKFDPSATNGIGHDHSGNGNNFTANNFTTSGTGTDVMSDTPTKNWATLNPIYRSSYADSNLVYSEGNLKVTSNANNKGAVANFAVNSGKWYYEATKTNDEMIGWHPADIALTNYPGGTAGVSLHSGGNVYHDGSNTAYGSSNTADIIGCAVDFDNEKFYWSINGTWQNSADPAANTGGFSFPTSCQDVPLVPAFRVRSGTSTENIIFNAGQRDFEYTQPTGFKALNTANLPEPEIKDGSKNFNTVLYTGDGASSRSITGVGFQPDWTWLKRRSGAGDHSSYDVLRGATKLLQQSNTNAEQTLSNSLTSFDSDGFGVGTYENASSVTYVGWNWLAGGSGSSNTDGSITSTVSVNATAGFSIVSYTGNVTAGATVGHGLGVAPDMIIVKNRDTSGYHWIVYHKAIGATKYLYLSGNFNAGTYTNYWNNTAPSSTVFTIGTDNAVNANGQDMIAYCFAEVEGYSKFGSYTGNGNANGPFVYCGFKPAWVLVKTTNSAQDWMLLDAARDTYNPAQRNLRPNQSNSEDSSTARQIDFTSNGFKIRSSEYRLNEPSQKMIFAAFAENPFGGDGVSPATAR